MVIGPLINLAGSFIESLFSGASKSSSSTSASAGNQASPFAEVLNSLKKSNPAELKTVTQQIAGYLKTL